MTDEMTPQGDAMPAPENPITPQNVTSQPEEPPLPDASILKQRIQQVLGGGEPQPQPSPEYSKLQQQIEALQQQRGYQPPQPKPPSQDQLIKELKEQQAALEQRQQQWLEEREREQATNEMAQWISSQEQHFPLTNMAGYQNVPMLKIETEKARTGRVLDPAKAAQLVEAELTELVKKLAPKIGFVMRDEQTAGSEEAPDIDPTTSGLNIDLPPNWDDMDPDEAFEFLKKGVGRR